MRILIIGAGAAGISAAETIRNHKADAEITIITKDKCPPFSPVALPDYIEGKVSKEQMLFWEEKVIREKRIDLLLGRTVVSVNPDKRTVQTDDGSILRGCGCDPSANKRESSHFWGGCCGGQTCSGFAEDWH